jgi:hypothetical protein
MAATTYHDRWIDCDAEEIRIRGYYFPWGTKHIPYAAIRRIRDVEMTPLRGKGRIWGTASPKVWASLDPRRARKSRALVVDVGARVKPFINPDDPDGAIAAISAHTSAPVERESGSAPLT